MSYRLSQRLAAGKVRRCLNPFPGALVMSLSNGAGPLTVFQRNGGITQGRLAATCLSEMIAGGNSSCT